MTALMVASGTTAMAQECKNRGQLDTLYCDENNDLVADVPTDPKKLRDPSTLVFAYTPVEDPAVYQNVFKPLTDFLAQCTGKRVVYYPVQSNSAEIEAMRSGRLHVAGFSTGPTGFAVNMAGAVPFAAKGTEKGPQGYHLLSIVKKDSPYQKLADLKGKRVAHTSPSSNSGHLAPLVLYPPEGLKPNEDYKPLMSGGHDKSALGVASGDYDMAGVASDVFERMITRGTLKADDFRIIFTSPTFPDLVLRLRARSPSGSLQENPRLLLCLRLPALDAQGVQRRRPLLPDHLQGRLESGARDRRRVRHALQQGGLRGGSKARGRGAGKEAARAGGAEAVVACEGMRAMDVSTPLKPVADDVDRALVIRNLRKEYRPGQPVLKDVSLTVEGRGMTAIIGPSGTGKSTLVRCINRLVDPTAGEIHFRGHDLVAARRPRVARWRAAASAWCSRNTIWSSGSR